MLKDGIEDGVRRVIENALKNGSTPEDIAKVTFISLDEIIRIQEEKLVGTK